MKIGKTGIIILGLLAFISCFLYVDDTYTTIVMPRYASTRQMGDMNGDGKITAADVALLYRYVRGNKTVIDSEAIKVADLSGDGEITVSDVSLLYRKLRSITNDDSGSKDDTKDDNKSDSTSDSKEPKSFETDSWNTIIENVKKRNTDAYVIGAEKEVLIAGFGKYKVRVANKTTTGECLTSGFSQSACGFVLEFSDIIVKNYPPSSHEDTWGETSIRNTVMKEIYEGLPDELKKGVIDTKVVSGYRASLGTPTTNDKVYLLSARELWGDLNEKFTYAINEEDAKYSRQLDYYAEKGVTGDNYNGASKKYMGNYASWGLRSITRGKGQFDRVESYGASMDPLKSFDNEPFGISPAFRIGE